MSAVDMALVSPMLRVADVGLSVLRSDVELEVRGAQDPLAAGLEIFLVRWNNL